MPLIAFGQPAWIDTALDAVEKRVSAVTGLPRDRVFSFAGNPEDLLEHLPAERFITCWFESLQIEQDLFDGGGAANTGFDDVLLLDLFVRLGTDREFTDTKLLRDQSFGFARTVKKLCQSIQGHPFIGSDNTSLFREPTRVLSVRLNPRKPATGWARATVRAQARFVADLSGA